MKKRVLLAVWFLSLLLLAARAGTASDERDLVSGLQQVVTLVKTAGTTYSSSDLHFGPSYQEK